MQLGANSRSSHQSPSNEIIHYLLWFEGTAGHCFMAHAHKAPELSPRCSYVGDYMKAERRLPNLILCCDAGGPILRVL